MIIKIMETVAKNLELASDFSICPASKESNIFYKLNKIEPGWSKIN
jgi:hypothetical protein